MREKSPRSMLRWISRTYNMTPAALARMFQHDSRTVSVWLKDGRISRRSSTKIRSAFYYLNNLPDPHDPRRSGIDMV
jgi:threonine dehydratase